MQTIEAQIELENKMIARGAEQYLKNQRTAETSGRGSELDYSRRLMKEYIADLVQALEKSLEFKGPRIRGRAKGLLLRIDPTKAIFITMKGLFNSFTIDQPLVKTAVSIGKMIEDEIRFDKFQEDFKDYYDEIIQDFQRKKSKDYRYRTRVLTHSANTKDDGWISWTTSERADVGIRLLDIIAENTDLVEKVVLKVKANKTEVTLRPTEEAKKWIDDHESFMQFIFADKAPCIVPPDDWTSIDQGGYYTPVLRKNTPMVKTRGQLHEQQLRKSNLKAVMDALNIVQSVSWKVNTDVLQIIKAVWSQNLGIGMPSSEKMEPRPSPVKDIAFDDMNEYQKEQFIEWKKEAVEVYTKEKERVGKSFQVTRILRMANEYAAYNEFWYVWSADFRGRIYSATAGFSPQGPDVAKGLLQFSTGKPLGKRGLHWLKIHGANRYGYDKVSYDDRVQWVDARHEEFMRAAGDPLSYREVWKDADKPYQFLAFLFEYRRVYELVAIGFPAEEFVSYLPIGLDGSCNGLQNFSAALSDDVGGTATNLVPADKPADIYSEVASVCSAKVRALAGTDPLADLWIAYMGQYGKGSIPRSMAKRPVMTLPYGATRQSCTKYVFLDILDNDNKFFPDGNFKAACWLTPLLWESIGEVVVAAREGMDWLQKCAGILAKSNQPIMWTTADGFVAVQDSKHIDLVRIDTQLLGRFTLGIGAVSDKLDAAKQRQGVSPNFVHSQDAAHLRTTVRLARSMGITNMALIHDDYGTHACDTDLLHTAIREAFVCLYTAHNPLADFKRQQEAAGLRLPPLPPKGTLDVNRVRESLYFFG